MQAANYAPIYAACLYPELEEMFRTKAWALAVHGSLAAISTSWIIIVLVCGGFAGAFAIAVIIECSEDILDWLNGY